ncbi:hypothetical protein K7W42_13980 [Deinococcus sp. HMF7604]|uniref:hypothetical protein n=1 Tax=Deinococcus betulae TaxID=2873312 RepID=UPI001CCD834D|nr:hypothetical protein [Deinococcus betulae]MBZ9751965.1 hypothetical protein [Deinococcus betulae]
MLAFLVGTALAALCSPAQDDRRARLEERFAQSQARWAQAALTTYLLEGTQLQGGQTSSFRAVVPSKTRMETAGPINSVEQLFELVGELLEVSRLTCFDVLAVFHGRYGAPMWVTLQVPVSGGLHRVMVQVTRFGPGP